MCQATTELEHSGWSTKIIIFLDQVADFFEIPVAFETNYTVSFLWNPDPKDCWGKRTGRLMSVELAEGSPWEDHIDVVVHEFIHDLRVAIPREKADSFAKELLKADNKTGLFFLQYYNEGLACALGQGLFVARYLPARLGGNVQYNWFTPGIVNDFAHAVYPAVKGAMDNKATMRSYAAQFLEAIRPLAKDARVGSFLQSHILITDSVTSPLIDALENTLGAAEASVFSLERGEKKREEARKMIAANEARPVVVMVEPSSLDDVFNILGWTLDRKRTSILKEKAASQPVASMLHSPSGRFYLLILGTRQQLAAGLPLLKALGYASSDVAGSLEDGKPFSF